MFDIYEKKLNAITKKYDSILAEQFNTPTEVYKAAMKDARSGKLWTTKTMGPLFLAITKIGFENISEEDYEIIKKHIELSRPSIEKEIRELYYKPPRNVNTPIANKLWAEWTHGSKILKDYLRTGQTDTSSIVYTTDSSSIPTFIDKNKKFGRFTIAQIESALSIAKNKEISFSQAIEEVAGTSLNLQQIEETISSIQSKYDTVDQQLMAIDQALFDKTDELKEKYGNTRLTWQSAFRGYTDSDKEEYNILSNYVASVYKPAVGSVLPSIEYYGKLLRAIQAYEKKYQTDMWTRFNANVMNNIRKRLADLYNDYKRLLKAEADTQSMENFYKQIPDLLWREVERVQNFETGYRNDPTGIFPRWQGNIQVSQPGLNNLNDKVENYIRKNIGDKLDFYINFSEIFRDKETFTNYVLDPKNREQAIYKLQDLYVDILSLEELIQLQENNLPIKIKLPSVPEMSLTTKDEDGQTVNWGNYKLRSVINTNNIKSAINWFAVQLPNRISAYDQRAETSISRAVTNIDFEALDQKAKSQAEQMLQSIERGRSAGEEELANREQIRQSAEDSVLQDKLRAAHQAASALAIQTQFNLRDEAISAQEERRKNVEQTLETLNLIISAIDVAINNVDNRSIKDIYEVTNYIGIVFQSIDGTYFEDDRITSTLNQIDTKFQDLLKAKLADISTQLDQSNDLAQVELEKTSNRDINEDVVTQLLQTLQESDLVRLKSAYPKGFVEFDLDTTAVEPKVTQLESSIAELNRRLERSNDPFFVLWYEIRDDIADLYKNKDNADLNNLLDVVEKLDELESLIDDDNMQLNYDNQLNSFETIVDIVVQLKLKEVASLVREFFPLFTFVDGKYVPKEGIDYSDFSSYVDLWELFKTIEEMYDALDLEPSELYIAIAKELSLIGSAIPLENIPFGGRSEEEFIDWITKYGPQSSGRGDGAIEVSGREEFRNTSFDEIGLPMYTDKGDYLGTETQRRKYIRNKAMNSTAKEVRVLLKKRRLTHFDSLPQFAGPGQARKDPYIKEIGKGMEFKDRNRFERFEVIHVTTGFMLDNYLDKYINLAGEYMPQLKPVEYGDEFDAPEFSGLSNEFD